MMRHLVLAAAIVAIYGCAHRPPALPNPPKTPGTINFTITGSEDAVRAFARDVRIPATCMQKPAAQDKPGKLSMQRSAAVQVSYRCQNTTPETFRQLAEIYFAVLNRNTREKAASVGPVRLSQTGEGLSFQATTTECLRQYCSLDTEYEWMPPFGACTDFCY